MIFIKCLIFVLIFSSCLCLIVMFIEINYSHKDEWTNATISVKRSKIFDMYLEKFNKSYSDDEYQMRLSYFRDSMREISFLNGVTGAKHGWTRFTDMSKEEFSQLMLKPRAEPYCIPQQSVCVPTVNKTIFPDDRPDKVDWRTKGAIGPVVEQLKCACCWAISTVGNMEAMAVIRGFKYQQLSVQHLISCSRNNNGCSGGSMSVLKFLCKHKFAVTTEEQYPLKLIDSKCRSNLQGIRRIKEYWVKCDMDEDVILRIIAHYGPVVVVVNAGPLMSYNGGIIQRACYRSHDGFSVDHMVQIVGYDLSGSIPYYIVKNSWGTLYGENGYVRLEVKKNMCGLADEVAYFDVY